MPVAGVPDLPEPVEPGAAAGDPVGRAAATVSPRAVLGAVVAP